MKAVSFATIRGELFHPTNIDNKESTSTFEHLAPTVAAVIIDDMIDQKKATYNTHGIIVLLNITKHVW
eukprot:10197840-Ditylum_brightwellii.AAC.1